MVQKVRKKGYFSNRRRLRIIVLLIVVALCFLITAFIVKLVDNQQTKTSKSSQTPTPTAETCSNNENENKKYRSFANDFESNPENKTRDLFGIASKISKSLDFVLIKKLFINSTVLELKSPLDENTQSQVETDVIEEMFAIVNLETLLHYWEWMGMLNIRETQILTEPEQVNRTIIVEKQLVLELCDYNMRIIALGEFHDAYKMDYGDQAKNMVLFLHVLTFMNSLEIRLFSLIIRTNIGIHDFKEWQSEKKNKLVLLFLNKFQHIVLGLPLFMIFHFIAELNTREMTKDGEQNYGQYKPLLERLLNADTFTKEQMDVIKGKFYKLFSILETQEIQGDFTEDEHDKIDDVYQLLQPELRILPKSRTQPDPTRPAFGSGRKFVKNFLPKT